MPLNISNITSSVNMGDQVQAINLLSGGLFGVFFLLSAMASVFMIMRVKTTTDDMVLFTFVLWFGTILSMIMRALDIVPTQVVVLILTLNLISVGFLLAVKR